VQRLILDGGSSSAALLALLGAVHVVGCAREIDDGAVGGPDGNSSDGGAADGGFDGGAFGNADPSGSGRLPDGTFWDPDAAVTADAFFIDDPPPMYCGPDGGGAPPDTPEGTPVCPDDKNREGCPCPEPGLTAACWPGKRIHRNHGICRDGTTVCRETAEFGRRWGACEGYVLPSEDAVAGPQACGCFSSGTWAIDNLVPCIHPSGMHVYSSIPSGGFPSCGENVPAPPPLPGADWSENTLTVDCAGQFRLCFAIKAGDIERVQADDCMVMQHCIDVWYPEAGATQQLPPIPAWVSADTQCAALFEPSRGIGYGEMTVIGETIECGAIDDGAGNPYVIHRTKYCDQSCQQTPDAPQCSSCGTGASGMFGP
jgi:hypothetical protein